MYTYWIKKREKSNDFFSVMGPVSLDKSSVQDFRELLNLNIVSYMATSKVSSVVQQMFFLT